MHGFGSHALSVINADGVRHGVKLHHVTQQGSRTWPTPKLKRSSERIGKAVSATCSRGIEPAISRAGNYSAGHARSRRGHGALPSVRPFDFTKVWPHGDYPLIEVGQWELNRDPDNYFAEVGLAAFSPARVVRGIGFSPDTML